MGVGGAVGGAIGSAASAIGDLFGSIGDKYTSLEHHRDMLVNANWKRGTHQTDPAFGKFIQNTFSEWPEVMKETYRGWSLGTGGYAILVGDYAKDGKVVPGVRRLGLDYRQKDPRYPGWDGSGSAATIFYAASLAGPWVDDHRGYYAADIAAIAAGKVPAGGGPTGEASGSGISGTGGVADAFGTLGQAYDQIAGAVGGMTGGGVAPQHGVGVMDRAGLWVRANVPGGWFTVFALPVVAVGIIIFAMHKKEGK